MSAQSEQKKRQFYVWLSFGFAGGFVAALILLWALMPGMMIMTHESPLSVDETVARLETRAGTLGWSSPGTLDLNRSLAKHDVSLGPQVRVLQLCQPQYARDILVEERHVSSLMPCGVAVWEGDDGKTYVSKMNTGVMGKLFGGVIADIMGGKVSADMDALLSVLHTE